MFRTVEGTMVMHLYKVGDKVYISPYTDYGRYGIGLHHFDEEFVIEEAEGKNSRGDPRYIIRNSHSPVLG